jgi:two-component system cell cycle sensor histidine kinase/response regulator CckA
MFNLFKTKSKVESEPFQLSNLIEILQDGVCITKVSGEFIYLNKAAYDMLGVDPAVDITSFNLFEDCIKDESVIDFLKQQIDLKGLVRNHETTLYRIKGESLNVLLTINIIGDFRQQTIGFLFLFKDISEFKKIQQQLLQSQKLESIGLMASGIAHDFNNILAAIIPNAELIKYSMNNENENYKRAEIIEKSAHRASDISQRLLTFTRFKEKQFEEPIDINQLADDSLDLLQSSIPRYVNVTRQFEENLSLFKGDAAQIQQILMNLMINAIDAMPNGGTIRLQTKNFTIENYYEIGSLDPGKYVLFSIKDTGSGIPMELIPKIFDPFFTTKEIGKGTGLGLSVVYGIVKSLGGHIEVDSEVNKGTRFDLYFPVPDDAPTVEKPEAPEVKPQHLHILIVDDEDYVLNILGDILEFLGYQVTKFSNGHEAILYYQNNHDDVDYVIVDLKMPKLDGRATCAGLRKINPEVKIVFTSGFDDSPMSDEDSNGVIGFLKKPYSINLVSKTLKEMLVK